MGYTTDSPPRRRSPDRDRRRPRSRSRSPQQRRQPGRSRSRERRRPQEEEARGGSRWEHDDLGGGGGGGEGRERERERRSDHKPQKQQQQHRRHGDGSGGGARNQEQPPQQPPQPAAPEPNFGVSGKLAAETNEVNGVVLKFQPPPEARRCTSPRWRLYVFRGQEQVGDPLPLDKFPYFLFGKERRVADVPTDHPSCSRQHAVIVFREVERASSLKPVIVPYIVDLGSANGTFVNGERIEASRYVELLERDVIRFGLSTREYVLLNDKSAG